MIVYADSSAIVKRYLTETGSTEVDVLFDSAAQLGTVVLARAEVSAALGKAVRVALLTPAEARQALRLFRADWPHFARLAVDERTVARADDYAWQYSLRGYDAVHLAAAALWREALAESVTLATFDRQLWQAARPVGLDVWPAELA